MKNKYFDIGINKDTGAINSIVFVNDKTKMNWCSQDCEWGLIRSVNRYNVYSSTNSKIDEMVLQDFEENEVSAVSVYSNGMIKVTVNRFFNEKGRFVERYTIKNIRDTDIFIAQDNFGIYTPLRDRYTYAEECMKYCCNAHIWCGQNTSYINALRMGDSDCNLGLVLTKGSLESYSIEGCFSNIRGEFILNSSFINLSSGEETVIEWEIFRHSGNEEFFNIIGTYDSVVTVSANHFTVFEDEHIEFLVKGAKISKNTEILCNGEKIEHDYHENEISVKYKPGILGKHIFEIQTNDHTTYAEFNVVTKFDELVEKRINYIIDNQQCKKKNSPLYGAFLIYDTVEKHQVYDEKIPDHNACRERLGMALLISKYLQKHTNNKFRYALNLYMEFVFRELYDEETGIVYGYVGKQDSRIRLYDAPWMLMLFSEMYILTRDSKYADRIAKTIIWYYENGGLKFYPNGVSFKKLYSTLEDSQNSYTEKVLELMSEHAENIINNGVFYPKHEVNYEQTIVTPAVTLISEMGFLKRDNRYAEEAKIHIKNLERFNGHQPSFHLNEIPIRYWDDFWFGKALMMGDTFPHYWSCLTAHSYFSYYEISGESVYLEAGKECLRNCFCLFNEKGEGSCAYVYPYKIDGKRGQFYDEWANDQDFALYFALGSQKYLKWLRD